jgi:hypothetical protein
MDTESDTSVRTAKVSHNFHRGMSLTNHRIHDTYSLVQVRTAKGD